jgi:hypothetical protein
VEAPKSLLSTPKAGFFSLAQTGLETALIAGRSGRSLRPCCFIQSGEPLEPPPLSPARGPPTDWGELVQAHDERDAIQTSTDDLPVIDIHAL